MTIIPPYDGWAILGQSFAFDGLPIYLEPEDVATIIDLCFTIAMENWAQEEWIEPIRTLKPQ